MPAILPGQIRDVLDLHGYLQWVFAQIINWEITLLSTGIRLGIFPKMKQDHAPFHEIVNRRLDELAEKPFAFASRSGIPYEKLRGVLRSDSRRADPKFETAREICEALGLEFYIGPPRNIPMPNVAPPTEEPNWLEFSTTKLLPSKGTAKCSVKGWSKGQELRDPLPAPLALKDPKAFYVQAAGQSMLPEGISAGNTALVSPDREPQDGDRVWILNSNSETSIKRLLRRDKDRVVTQGWLPIADGKQQSFEEEHVAKHLKAVHPIVAVYRGTPGTEDVEYLPDPKQQNIRPLDARELDTDFTIINMHPMQQDIQGGDVAKDNSALNGLAFPNEWLRFNGISPGNASLLVLEGDEMEPTFGDGSTVLINHNRKTIRSRRVYAFMRDGDMLLHRLEVLPDGQLLMLSDNHKYPTVLIPASEREKIEVIGEVVWAGRQFK